MPVKMTLKDVVERLEGSEKHVIGRLEVIDTKQESIERGLREEIKSAKRLSYATLAIALALLGFLVGIMVRYLKF